MTPWTLVTVPTHFGGAVGDCSLTQAARKATVRGGITNRI
jgi:hypothetical protein